MGALEDKINQDRNVMEACLKEVVAVMKMCGIAEFTKVVDGIIFDAKIYQEKDKGDDH